jgi:hypothetical protein
MTGYLAYTAARAQVDDLHRIAADERLAATVRPRRRLRLHMHRRRAPIQRPRLASSASASRARSS